MSSVKDSSRHFPPPRSATSITPLHSPVKGAKYSGNRKSKERERRWTTGLEKGQLDLTKIKPLISDDSSMLRKTDAPSTFSLSSWNSTLSDLDNNDPLPTHLNALRTPTPTSDSFSQPDVVQELMQMGKHFGDHVVNNHQYQLSYEMAVDSSPLSPSNYVPNAQEVMYCSHIVQEIITTEKRYIKDLSDIIEGYRRLMIDRVSILPITHEDITDLFGNIQEILTIHENLLQDLEDSESDYQKIGNSFISRAEDFKCYTEYCNNYPKSIEMFSKLVSEQGIPWFMKKCQQNLKHLLPLGAYLLKPVQRILKYSLLLEDLHRHMKRSNNGYQEIMTAKSVMTQVANHINEMKRKYDDTVRVQEIQSLLHGWEGKDLVKYGEIVLEDTLKVASSKGGSTKLPTSALRSTKELYVFLFQKMLLLTKRKDEGYLYKHHIEMKDMQLSEHLKENILCFQIRQISNKSTLTFQARSPEIRSEWSEQIKELLIQSIPHLPSHAKQLILQGFHTDLQPTLRPVTKLETSKTLPRNLQNGSPTRQLIAATQGKNGASPKSQRQGHAWQKSKAQPTRSLMDASLTGFLIGSPSKVNQEDKKPLHNTYSSPEDFKKNRRLRFDSLPNHATNHSWKRSDSDSELPEEGSRPSSSRTSPNEKDYSRGASPMHLPTVDDSRSSSGSPANQLAVIGVRNSISSPDLKATAEGTFIEEEEGEEEISTVGGGGGSKGVTEHRPELNRINTNENSRPLTPLSPTDCSEISFNIAEDSNESYLSNFPAHMRSKSVPLHIHESRLETIPSSIDNTPRGSLTKDEHVSPVSIGSEDDDFNSSPRPVVIVHQSSIGSNKEDDLIEIKPSLELSGSHTMGEQVDSSKNKVANIESKGSPVIMPNKLDSISTKQSMEMMFEELMSGSVSHSVSPSLHSQDIPLNAYDKHSPEEHLGQSELDEVPSVVSPISIPEIKVDLARSEEVPTTPDYQKEHGEHTTVSHPAYGWSMDSSTTIGETPASTTPMRYSRQTTPYTSIEDIPSEIEKCESQVDPLYDDENLIFANFNTTGTSSVEDWMRSDSSNNNQLSPPPDSNETITTANVRRWHSLRSERINKVEQSKDEPSPAPQRKTSQPSKVSEKIDWQGIILRRNHSFKEQRHAVNPRPISLIALVHSTRDNSDLVDLHSIQQNRKAMECADKDEPEMFSPIQKNLKKDSTPPSLHNDSSMHSPPESSHAKSKSFDISDTDEASNQQSLKKNNSVGSTGNPDYSRARRNRWSLKRTLNRTRKRSVKQDSTSDDESKCSSVSEVSISETPSHMPTELITQNVSVPVISPITNTAPVDGMGNVLNESTDFDENLEIPLPGQTRVQSLARDYSMRIKEQQLASCSPVQEERSCTTSPRSPLTDEHHVGSIPSSSTHLSTTTAPTPSWLKSLKDKRKRSSTVSGKHHIKTGDLMSLSQPTSPEPTSPYSSISPLSSTRSNSGTPTPEVKTPSSTDTAKTFNFERTLVVTEDEAHIDDLLSSGLQKYASESVLTKSIDSVIDKPVAVQPNGKRKKPGWVRYLVKKFNTPK